MKHGKRDPSSGFSSSRSNISRAMRVRSPKISDFLVIRNQNTKIQTELAHELALPTQSAPPWALKQVEPTSSITQSKRTSDRNRRSSSYYGFDNSSSGSTIAAQPNSPRRAGNVDNFKPPASVVETVQNKAVQQPEEINISPIIGEVSPPAPRVLQIIDQDIPTLARSMTFLGLKLKRCLNS